MYWGFLLVLVLGGVVTTLVTIAVQRSSAPLRTGTREGVLFVVSSRTWQRVLLRTVGIAVLVVGCFSVLMAFVSSAGSSNPAMGVVGLILAVLGIASVWAAHSRARVRLEVTTESVWVFHTLGEPQEVRLAEVTRLVPISSNSVGGYGGVVAKSAKHRLFSATRIMLGYPQLIDHLRERRPDLVIPDASLPL